MTQFQVPEFQTYEEEATFWDNLDTADCMDDDGEWFHFDTPHQRAVRIPILPNIVELLQKRAHAQGVSVETLVNVILLESVQETAVSA
ncbi:MAG: CopG family antitoxin [Caldilineaceae bacterium]